MESDDTAVERGSTNVFADLGFPDTDAHLVKTELVSRIGDIMCNHEITQTEAARLMDLSPPDVSRPLRGDFHEYSLECLFQLLTNAWARCRHRRPLAALGRGGKLRIVATGTA